MNVLVLSKKADFPPKDKSLGFQSLNLGEDFYNDECELAEAEEIEAQYLDELKEDACATAGTGEFSIWHFDPELGDNE